MSDTEHSKHSRARRTCCCDESNRLPKIMPALVAGCSAHLLIAYRDSRKCASGAGFGEIEPVTALVQFTRCHSCESESSEACLTPTSHVPENSCPSLRGSAAGREPAIHNTSQEYGFRARRSFAAAPRNDAMTKLTLTGHEPHPRPGRIAVVLGRSRSLAMTRSACAAKRYFHESCFVLSDTVHS